MRTFLLAAALAVASSAHAAELFQQPNPIPGRYIVVLHDESSAELRSLDPSARIARRESVAAELARRHGGRAEHVYRQVVHGFVASLREDQARAMLRDPRVRFIEQDSIVRIAQTVQPNATWGLDRIDERDLPLDRLYAYTRTGRGVTAYIIDTGIRTTHAEFTGRSAAGFSAINDGRGTTDCNGHGTHVAGTVGGTTFGVAKQVTVVPVRVLDCNGSGANSGVIAGVDWVTANHRKPAVANMSLGGGASTALDEAVRRSIATGVTYALAAGNSNADACSGSPSRVTQALVVGASTNTDARASFSNLGACVDLFAPGQNIASAWITNDTATNTISGTSMAAPHVAGVAALVLEANPAATPDQVAQTILNGASANKISGAGSGSPTRLLFSQLDAPAVDPAPVALFTANCNARTCSFDASRSTDNAPITSYEWSFGDGTSAVGRLATKTFGSDGTFTVVLRVVDSGGQADTETLALTIASPGPGAPCTTCTRYAGSLARANDARIEPAGQPFASVAGTLRGWLQGPANTDFDLFLERQNGSSWQVVARAEGNTSTETISFNATAGVYRWRVFSYRGAGNYTFWMQRP